MKLNDITKQPKCKKEPKREESFQQFLLTDEANWQSKVFDQHDTMDKSSQRDTDYHYMVLPWNQDIIYCPILDDKAATTDDQNGVLFNSLAAFKAHMVTNDRKTLLIPDMGDILGTTIQRMLTFLTCDTSVNLLIYRPKQVLGPRSNVNQNVYSTTNLRSPNDEVLLMHIESKTYADLRTIKMAVNPSVIGVEIKTMKRTTSDSDSIRSKRCGST